MTVMDERVQEHCRMGVERLERTGKELTA